MTYREKALGFARAQLGVKESPAGSNDGPDVKKYQAVTNEFRQPWCASFVQWCLLQAGYPQPFMARSAYVPFMVSYARRMGWVVTDPEPGDLACFDWEHDGVSDHIGFVETVDGDSFRTIEGNTSVGSNSNGGEVMRRTRYRSQVTAFIRVPGDSPTPLAPMWAWFKWKDDGAPKGQRPSNVPARVPARWWVRYQIHRGIRK